MRSKAKRYIELSNAHDLDAIEAMFSEDATYRSSNVGEYQGRGKIMAMMRKFFALRPDISWQIDELREIEGGIEFDFRTCDGQGTERVYFDDAGLIRRIEVDTGVES